MTSPKLKDFSERIHALGYQADGLQFGPPWIPVVSAETAFSHQNDSSDDQGFPGPPPESSVNVSNQTLIMLPGEPIKGGTSPRLAI